MPLVHAVSIIGTHPPTRCGLATFTESLREAIAGGRSGWQAGVIRVVDGPEAESDPHVQAVWLPGEARSYDRAVAAMDRADVVILQHEYGIFGAGDGEAVVDLVAACPVPLIAVLHTVLAEPSAHQREVIEAVMDAAAAVVVQSQAARERLLRTHEIDADAVTVIPHGAAPNFSAPSFVATGDPQVLTWGLLGPGKGIEHGIAAIARLADLDRPPVYIVAGETHPKVRAIEGERYRRHLVSLAERLGVGGRVVFDDDYHSWSALRSLVRRADVVLLPYDSRDQVTSGVLVEALASGKPVVATRFPHAEELLSSGAGIVVDQGDAGAMAAALRQVLCDSDLASGMRSEARRQAIPLLWPSVGASYRHLVQRVLDERAVAA